MVQSQKKKKVSVTQQRNKIIYKWKKFYYIGKLSFTGPRIVYLEIKVLTEPDEEWVVKAKIKDRNININPEGLYKDRDINIKFLTPF